MATKGANGSWARKKKDVAQSSFGSRAVQSRLRLEPAAYTPYGRPRPLSIAHHGELLTSLVALAEAGPPFVSRDAVAAADGLRRGRGPSCGSTNFTLQYLCWRQTFLPFCFPHQRTLV